jgi:hypothetical protein
LLVCCHQLEKATADAAELKAGYDKYSADAAEFKAGYDKLLVDMTEQQAQVCACIQRFICMQRAALQLEQHAPKHIIKLPKACVRRMCS